MNVKKISDLYSDILYSFIFAEFDMVIGRYVYDKVVDLHKRTNDIITACNSKLKSEYKDCKMCVNKCSFHTTSKKLA